MEMNEIREKLDGLLKNYRLEEAEAFMLNTLENAEESGREDVMLGVANELVGFYRDCGRFGESLKFAEMSETLLEKVDPSPKARAAALLNSANAARAAGQLSRAYDYYEKIANIPEAMGDDSLKASYFNNLALLHQESGRWEDAADCLREALAIAEKEGEEIRCAISRTNLAACLVQMNNVYEAECVLQPAIETLAGRSPSDFHYSGALAAYGDICAAKSDHKKAAEYYEAALSEIELHMGRNNFYEIVSEKLHKAYEYTTRPTKGMDISRSFYNAFGRDMLKRRMHDGANPDMSGLNLLSNVACGLAGEGSECFGFDDEVSRDHDFAPCFCIWVNDLDNDIPRSLTDDLHNAYSLLPKSYMGLSANETAEGHGRRGVILLSEFLEKFTGLKRLPDGDEWLDIQDEDLACAVNGQIFSDRSGFFTEIRRKLKARPRWVDMAKLSVELEKIAKHGQYNFPRMTGRGDSAAAFFELSEFMMSVLRACHLIAGKYAPYRKWLYKSCEGLCGGEFADICQAVGEISRMSIDEAGDIQKKIEEICGMLNDRLIKRHIIDVKCGYMAASGKIIAERSNAMSVAEDIIEMEWAAFDKVQNKGGRANCQDDRETFLIMRRGQYYSFPAELLCAIRDDFAAALKAGRNFITEKYGYMMESYAPEEFEEIRSKLPEVSEKKRALCSAITPIQVGWMEDFAKRYPNLGGRARVIHTAEDTAANVSYETYLRGELYSYSDETLELYGRFIVSVYNRGENLAKSIMQNEVYMYGYNSLDEAEQRADNGNRRSR